MLKYGGGYSDLDTWCLRNVENVTAAHGVTLAKLSWDESFAHNIPNAWMSSVPGHPFWKLLISMIELKARKNRNFKAEELTGPTF